MLTTMTLKRLASLGGSEEPMAAAARRGPAARTLGQGRVGKGFWRCDEVEGGLSSGRCGGVVLCNGRRAFLRGRFGRKEPYPVSLSVQLLDRTEKSENI